MYTLCWSAKGGSGTTVVAVALAMTSARTRPTLLVDLGGDVPAALGVATPTGPGVGEWLSSPHARGDALFDLATEVMPDLHLVGAGSLELGNDIDDVHAERLAHACAGAQVPVVIDAGRLGNHEVLHVCAERSLVVVRPCYLGLNRTVRRPGFASGAIVVHEPGRSLGIGDVERALGIPVLAEIAWDPAVARAVDAGLLARRLPSGLRSAATKVMASMSTAATA
jgi:hypothetical protein